MNTVDLLEKINAALSTDAELTAWCIDTYGQVQTVFIGVDDDKPPASADDYPVVAVTSIRQTRGDSAREISWVVELGVGIVQENVTTSGNTRTLDGLVEAETLRELTEDALYRAKILSSGTSSETGSISFFPLFVSAATIRFKTLKSTRSRLPG